MLSQSLPSDRSLLPIFSLVIAALAVFVGPILTWRLTGRQIVEARKTANKQIIAPMRQIWINKLRENIATFLHLAFLNAGRATPHQNGAHFENLMQILFEIQLSLNPTETDHKLLSRKLEELLDKSIDDPNDRMSDDWKAYWSAHEEVMNLASHILKTEWTRVKSEDAN